MSATPLIIYFFLIFSLFAFNTAHAVSFEQAVSAYNNKDYSKALKEFSLLAGKNDAGSLYFLGQMYRLGLGVASDLNTARDFYERSARQGNVNAQRNLGTIYYYAELQEADHHQAFLWLEKAAHNNDTWSQWLLAVMYHNGEGVTADNMRAYQWAAIAAKNGSSEALAMQNIIKHELSIAQLHQADTFSRMLLSSPRRYAPEKSKTDLTGSFGVQLGVFSTKQNADRFVQEIDEKTHAIIAGHEVYISKTQGIDEAAYRVMTGSFSGLEPAIALCHRLRLEKVDCVSKRR